MSFVCTIYYVVIAVFISRVRGRRKISCICSNLFEGSCSHLRALKQQRGVSARHFTQHMLYSGGGSIYILVRNVFMSGAHRT